MPKTCCWSGNSTADLDWLPNLIQWPNNISKRAVCFRFSLTLGCEMKQNCADIDKRGWSFHHRHKGSIHLFQRSATHEILQTIPITRQWQSDALQLANDKYLNSLLQFECVPQGAKICTHTLAIIAREVIHTAIFSLNRLGKEHETYTMLRLCNLYCQPGYSNWNVLHSPATSIITTCDQHATSWSEKNALLNLHEMRLE